MSVILTRTLKDFFLKKMGLNDLFKLNCTGGIAQW